MLLPKIIQTLSYKPFPRSVHLTCIGCRRLVVEAAKSNSDDVNKIPVFAGETYLTIDTMDGKDDYVSELDPEILGRLRKPLAHDLIVSKTTDGSLFLPEIFYRRILNEVFGPGAWSVVPVSRTYLMEQDISDNSISLEKLKGNKSYSGKGNKKRTMLAREYAFFAQGRYVTRGTGEVEFRGKWEQLSMDSEKLKTDALVNKICRGSLGIGRELDDRAFVTLVKSIRRADSIVK